MSSSMDIVTKKKCKNCECEFSDNTASHLNCPACEHNRQDQAKCSLSCPQCGKQAPVGAKFCFMCACPLIIAKKMLPTETASLTEIKNQQDTDCNSDSDFVSPGAHESSKLSQSDPALAESHDDGVPSQSKEENCEGLQYKTMKPVNDNALSPVDEFVDENKTSDSISLECQSNVMKGQSLSAPEVENQLLDDNQDNDQPRDQQAVREDEQKSLKFEDHKIETEDVANTLSQENLINMSETTDAIESIPTQEVSATSLGEGLNLESTGVTSLPKRERKPSLSDKEDKNSVKNDSIGVISHEESAMKRDQASDVASADLLPKNEDSPRIVVCIMEGQSENKNLVPTSECEIQVQEHQIRSRDEEDSSFSLESDDDKILQRLGDVRCNPPSVMKIGSLENTSGNRGRPIKRSFIDENNPTLPPAKKVSPSPQQSSLILSSTSVDPQENPKSVPSEATVNPGANDDIDENDRDYNPSPITKSDQSLPNDSGDKSNSNKAPTIKEKGSGADAKAKPSRFLMQLRSRNNVRGLNPDSSGSVVVTFHVIIPYQIWNFNENHNHIKLRFGDKMLGCWKENIGDFVLHRKTEAHMVMKCELNIAIDTARNKIPYKYIIFSKANFVFENLDNALISYTYRRGYVNRCLIIPEGSRHSGGRFDQYDGMILPPQHSDTFFQTFKNFFGVSPDRPKEIVELPKHAIAQKMCLELFLEEYKNILCCNNSMNTAFHEFIHEVLHIYKQLQYQWLCQNDQTQSIVRRTVEKFIQVFIEQIISISYCLLEIDTRSNDLYGRRMCSVLIIITLLRKTIQHSNEISHEISDILPLLFSMLLIKPKENHPQNILSEELMVVQQFIKIQDLEDVTQSLVFFANYVLKHQRPASPEWIYVLPLLHIFSRQSGSTEKLIWKDALIKLPTSENIEESCFSDMSIFEVDLLPLTRLDRMLLPQLVYICPKQELSYLFERIPIAISVSFVRSVLLNNQEKYFEFRKTVLIVPKLLKSLTDQIKKCSPHSIKFEELSLIFQHSQGIHLKVCSSTFPAYDSFINTSFLHTSITFLLYSFSKYLEYYPESHWDISCMMITMLRGTLTNKSASTFAVGYGIFNISKAESDIQIFEDLARIDCPAELSDMWLFLVLKHILHKKIHGLKATQNRIKLLNLLESLDNPSVIISDVITSAVMQAFEQLSPNERLLWSLYEKTNKNRDLVGKILHNIMKKRLPNTESVPMACLLDWNLWPLFISICRNENMRDQENQNCSCLSSHVDIMCSLAISKLEDIFKRCYSGDVTLEEITEVEKKSTNLERLCEVILSKSSEEEKTIFKMSYLKGRIEEATTFKQQKRMLSLFCEHLKGQNVVIKGLNNLIDEIGEKHERMNINELCQITDTNVSLMFFKSCQEILPILIKFDVLFRRYPNKFVLNFLKSAIQNSTSPSLEKFVPMIWDPVYIKCCELRDGIKEKSIKLKEVHNIYSEYMGNKGEINKGEVKEQLHLLQSALEVCQDQTPSSLPPPWIEDAVNHMENYLSLCTQASAANLILELRDKLELSGNFNLVENVAQKITSSMQNQPLSFIDNNNMVDAVSFFGELSSSPKKSHCIEAFSKCHDIVKWIQKETTEVNDLHKFVSVALHTSAGEGDFSTDKLSQLKIVGSGYGPLIYKLKPNSSFESFKEYCKEVWLSLEQTPKLARLLEACNKELEWFRSVKETQGSVEVTAIGQMNSILKNGCYFIGSSRPEIHQSAYEIVRLRLKEKDQESRIMKKKYNLEELHDLESKLVLITGSKAEYRNEVELFLDILLSICRIADVLLSLQQVGNVKYIGWNLQVPCSTNSDLIVNSLQDQLKVMEKELELWNYNIKSLRKEYYELNYYTTIQLLMLRQALGKIKTDESIVFDPDILALLQSINPKILSPSVVNAVCTALKKFSEFPEKDKTIPTLTDKDKNWEFIAQHSRKFIKNERQNQSHFPTTPEEELSEQQRRIMAFVVGQIECPTALVLKAFEGLTGGKKDKYDYLDWCNENLDKYSVSDNESDVTSNESDTQMSDDDEAIYEKGDFTNILDNLTPHEVNIKKIHASIIQQVDETHKFVQELVQKCSYPLDLSIKAVEATRAKSVIAALEYLQIQGENEGSSEQFIEQQFLRNNSNDYEDYDTDWDSKSELIIHLDTEAEEKYLTVEELGSTLNILSDSLKDHYRVERSFPTHTLKEGYPNLLVLKPDEVFKTVLHLYMHNREMPLPSPEEVFICNSSTSAEEIELFWRRAIHDPNHRRIFCLVHVEKLSSIVCDSALTSLTELSQAQRGYHLVILYCDKKEMDSQLIMKLQNYRRPFVPEKNLSLYKDYLAYKFNCKDCPSSAAIVDHESSYVRIITSQRSAMGKSLYIKRLGEKLRQNELNCTKSAVITIPLHGPFVDCNIVMKLLENHMKKSTGCIYHIDIASSVVAQVDTILFSLLILRGISDSRGKVWRCHPDQHYVVEVTFPNIDTDSLDNTLPEYLTMSLLSMLPSISCLKPQKALSSMKSSTISLSELVMDKQIFESDPYQRVYQYLSCYSDKGDLDKLTLKEVKGSHAECLEIILNYCGVKDPSWAEICYFVTFLDLQLQSCEESDFTNSALVGDILAGLKGFVVKFMIQMSRDFSTSSLKGEVAIENSEDSVTADDGLNIYQIHDRKKWEQSPHPYIFFNNDRATITFVGFVIQLLGQYGDLLNPYNSQVLEKSIITKQLFEGLQTNKVNFQDNSRLWTKWDMISKLSAVMGIEPHDPDESYVLTVDNVIKILAIQMRFRCGIPVVIMGETGCGKTRLIRYMCNLTCHDHYTTNMLILKVHGGKTETDIQKFIEAASIRAEENAEMNLDTIVFFDEANTTDAIDLIKEILCDRRLNGVPIRTDLKFIAACNPYRKHKDEMIARLENAGLGFFVKDIETQQKLGRIPLRQLVYRVLDLPPSMRPLVYDFGQLNQDTEMNYIDQIVQNHMRNHPSLSEKTTYVKPIATALKTAQAYMRKKDDECSFVSLRDVDRAMIVFEYFYDKMSLFGPRMETWAEDHQHADNEVEILNHNESSDCIKRALILSISMCYRARLQQRKQFDEEISACFVDPILLRNGSDQFEAEIRWCEEILLDSMSLGANIARNAALRENVFMMAICIELKMPLFIVGKPGSSKSLAKSIINESMRGKDSKNDLLKNFNEVQIFSYQCSQLSTSSSIIKLFDDAKKYQETEKQNKKSSVAVVVLDEVGLAEDSPNLPLKSLHPLLEDGTEGGDAEGEFADEIVERKDRVAFIGISNWALDPAKMNRGIMVTRNDPSEDELIFSARGICSNQQNDPVRSKLEQYFSPLARAYLAICKSQKREFFGLRDFYSLIKMLYNMCNKSERHPTWQQLEHAIKRNFGGFESEELNPFEVFEEHLVEEHLKVNHEPPDLRFISIELHPILCPDSSRLGLIRSSLSNTEKTWHGENRYVLFLTENYAALDILKNPKYLHIDVNSDDKKKNSEVQQQPFILFGSSFPKDKEYTQVCRNINQIKICMETGRTVILLNLENLYESLYDVLNQYYIHHADSRYVDLGLQTHRVRCRVANEFKLILIAEKKTVYQKFPTPLINRLEKHFVLISSVLEDWQENVLKQFEDWISAFSSPRNCKFEEKDAFIGFQKDTPASVLFHATNQLCLPYAAVMNCDSHHSLSQEYITILRHSNLDPTQCVIQQPDLWEASVLRLSKFLILQTASPDSIFRLKNTSLCDEEMEIRDIYFREQDHRCVEVFLYHNILQNCSGKRLLMQVTTHSSLLSTSDIKEICAQLDVEGFYYSLLAFDTELDFSNKIGPKFKKRETGSCQDSLVVIQCDSGHLYGDLIACARYRLYDLMARGDEEQSTHVLFIIHLPRQISSSLVGFQGDPWISAHIDDLMPSAGDGTIELDEVVGGVSISAIFIGFADPIGLHVGGNNVADRLLPTNFEESISLENPPRQDSDNTSSASSSEDTMLGKEAKLDEELVLGDEAIPGEVAITEVSDMESSVEQSVDQQAENIEEKQVYEDESISLEYPPRQDSDNTSSASSSEDTMLGKEAKLDEELVLGDEGEVAITEVSDMELGMEQSTDQQAENIEEKQVHENKIETTNINGTAEISACDSMPSSQAKRNSWQSKNPFYRRLYRCIQPAASRLKDIIMKRSTERVELLVRLIPKEINQTDIFQFHGIMINHIYALLRDKEKIFENEKDWILQESLSNKNLLLGGTLSNALSRRVHGAVVQVFAEIIASIDRNCNLSLIDPENCDLALSQLWLSIFSNSHVMQFKFTDFVKGKDYLPGIGARKSGQDFECKFPFSWLVYEVFIGLWNKVKSSGGSNNIQLVDQLCESVRQTAIGEILDKFEDQTEDFYIRYLHDFVRIIHVGTQTNSKNEKKLYEVLAESLDAVSRSENYSTSVCNATLIGHIATLHVVYQVNKGQVLWFGQLARYNPGAIVSLTNDEVRDSTEMILPLCAVDKALDSLNLELEKDSSDIKLIPWLQDLHNSQNSITSILCIPSQSSLQTKSRQKWHLLKALQMFVEHIMMQHPTMPIHFLRRLHLLLKKNPDFLTAKGLDVLQLHLNSTVKDAKRKDVKRKPKRYIEEVDKATFEEHCRNYFMEVISSLCFGQYCIPEPDLIKKLMQIVFIDNQTRELTFHKDGKKDRRPTIRSALLQLLLEYRSTDTKIYLEEYFTNSRQALSGDVNKYLCLMCIQCFEDAMHKESRSVEDVQDINKQLSRSYNTICKYESSNEVNIEYLEAVASIRFCLHIAADTFNSTCSSNQPIMSDTLYELFDQVKNLCTDQTINQTFGAQIIGPGMYFIRLLVRIFGFSSLIKVSGIFKWIIPESLSTTDQQRALDPFVIYNGYTTYRADIQGAQIGRQVDHLQESTKDMTSTEASILLLAFYQVITMGNAKASASMDEELVEIFDDYIRKMKSFIPLMLQIARCFLANAQGGPLIQMKITPDMSPSCKVVGSIIIHAISVLACKSRYPMLLPFVNMMSNTAALCNAYLPTMFEDPFVEVKKAGGMFYACPNGHPYFVGECGMPMVVRSCNVCSAMIGGLQHNLRSDNTIARSNDTTQTGYILGDASSRVHVVAPERTLSSAAVCIIRAIMHSSFIWFSCHHIDCIGDLVNIVKCRVPPDCLPEFFWMHLEKDIEQLSIIIGRSKDEAAVLIHLILKRILLENPPKENDTIGSASSLDSKSARKTWEEVFCTYYIEPVLEDLHNCLNEAMKQMVNDTSLEQDQLLNITYETLPVTSESLRPHLWTYRQRVSMEHLQLTIQERALREKYPILHDFLQLEPKLRATQYLPHIVKLQQTLYDTFNFRLDKSDAISLTVENFIQGIQNENSRNEYQQWITSLQKSWALVGQDLKTHGRMPVPESILPQCISLTTPLEYLIPTTTGAGVCTTALVDFLTLIHNDFIQKCHNIVAKDDKSQVKWLKNEVPITHIHQCHLLDYEDQIMSVILSHCHYSLRAGEAHTVKYDHQSLQKHILDKFIYGKPTILSDIPQVVYRTDIHTIDTFEAVRNKVKPQENIEPRIQKEILTELHTPDALRANLDVIDTVLGFLSSGGGKPNKQLGKYVEKVLKMRKGSFSRKAQEYCQLKHIISLWEILSVELAKITWLRNQEPFDLVSDKYLIELTDQDKVALDRCLRVFDLARLLGALYEFIETSARYCPENQLTWPLTTVLIEGKYEDLQIPDNFEEEFPDTITIAQTVSAWKRIVDYQEETKT